MVSASLYVEGGGDSKSLKTACRRGFRKFIENAGVTGGVSNIVACGSRGNAYRSFSKALSASVNALLLVDAEGSVTAQGVWQYLKANDNWDHPATATDDQCHLMVQAMESWFLADADALASFYGQDFNRRSASGKPEHRAGSPRMTCLPGLSQAARNTKKGGYKKGPGQL